MPSNSVALDDLPAPNQGVSVDDLPAPSAWSLTKEIVSRTGKAAMDFVDLPNKAMEWAADKSVDTMVAHGVPASVAGATGFAIDQAPNFLIGESALRHTPEIARGAARTARGLMDGSLIKTLTGRDIMESIAEGHTTTRPMVTQATDATERAAMKAESAAQRQTQKAQAAQYQLDRLDARLKAPKTQQYSLQDIGTDIRSSYETAMNAAKAERSEAGRRLWDESLKAAEAHEAAGSFVDTSEATGPLRKFMAETEGIPTVHNKLREMLGAVEGPATEGERASFVSPGGDTLFSIGPKATPRTFKELETARQYLNDVGYGTDLEGYTASMRLAARDAAKAIERAMERHTPEHARFRAEWKRLSEPLESMGTRLGRAIHATEGGVADSAYHAAAAEDLPAKFFSKADNVDLLVDALAGGKGATAEARARAERTVSELGLRYFAESFRQKPGAEVLKAMQSPERASVMNRLPGAAQRLRAPAEREVQMADRAGRLQERVTGASKSAQEATDAAQVLRKASGKLRDTLSEADAYATRPGHFAQKKALDLYHDALRQARGEGLLSADQFDTAIGLIDREATLEARRKRAIEIMGILGWTAGLGYGIWKVGHFVLDQ